MRLHRGPARRLCCATGAALPADVVGTMSSPHVIPTLATQPFDAFDTAEVISNKMGKLLSDTVYGIQKDVLKILLLAAATLAVQRLFYGEAAANFFDIVVPALKRVLTIGRSSIEGKAHLKWRRWLLLLLPAGVLQQRYAQQRAATLLEAQLLEAQRLPRSLREIGRALRSWQPQIDKVLTYASAIFGTGSAIKYLFRR